MTLECMEVLIRTGQRRVISGTRERCVLFPSQITSDAKHLFLRARYAMLWAVRTGLLWPSPCFSTHASSAHPLPPTHPSPTQRHPSLLLPSTFPLTNVEATAWSNESRLLGSRQS